MKNIKFKTLTPHLTAIALFVILSFGYFSPVLEGKMMRQGDMVNYAGASQEMKELRQQTGEYALWTDRMFGGMPTFLISNPGHANLTQYVHSILNLNHPRPANHIFLYLIGFYIALFLFGVNNPWLRIVGAIAYAFSSYFIIIIDAGHVTKVMALGYMPIIIAAVYDAYNNNRLRGSILLALFLSIQLYVNHLQITYYTLIVVLIMFLCQAIYSILKNKIKELIKPTLYLIVAAILAVGANLTTIWTVYEYGAYSLRGKPNIVQEGDTNKTSGLDKDYITSWSYGKLETLNLFIPNLTGGSSHMNLGENSESYRQIERNYGKQTAEQATRYMDTYWGDQPFTSGPVYIGASVILLFILGLFLVKGQLRWWIAAVTALSILLAWGRHFMPFSNFFIDYVPGYNKFRTVSMILVIAQFTIPLLGIITFDRILKNSYTFKQIKLPLIYSASILSFVCLVAWLAMPHIFEFEGGSDANYPELVKNSIITDRILMLRSDALRSLLFVWVTTGIVWAVATHKIKQNLAIIFLGILFLADLLPVSNRYAQNDNWVKRSELQKSPFKPSKADNQILTDKDHFRVLNLSANTFNDAATSYFHNSIGGYHGAKMQRYQEMVNHQIQSEMTKLITTLQNSPTYEIIDSVLLHTGVLNMLNTRYLILSPDNVPMRNLRAFGNAWFVENITWADNANEEMTLLAETDLRTSAVMDITNKDKAKTHYETAPDNTITLEKYSANRLSYTYSTKTESFAVFSEIYYPKGWTAKINGKEQEIFRTNYLLRSLVLPAGKGTIEFEFHPSSYFTGNVISTLFSALILVLGILVLYLSFTNKKNTVAAQQK